MFGDTDSHPEFIAGPILDRVRSGVGGTIGRALFAVVLALALLAPGVAHADGDDGNDDDSETDDPVHGMVVRIDKYLHDHEVAGITPDARVVLNPTEANRLSVVSQLLGYYERYRAKPKQVYRDDIVARADFCVAHFDEITSRTAFDGMLGYALLGAYEVTGDPRYRAKAEIIVEQSLQLNGFQNTLNWGLMSALALSKYYDLTGDARSLRKTLEIVASLAVYENADGSFPHYCYGSEDVHYTAWMSMELLIVRRYISSSLIDQYLQRTNAFLEQRVDPSGLTVYQEPCTYYPGCVRYYYGQASGCWIDYDTRGWINELGYTSLLFDQMKSPRFAAVAAALLGTESHGAFADKWGYPPPSSDAIYPWATGDPSVIRTSVIFWSLAQLDADRRIARHARYVADATPRGGRIDENGDAPIDLRTLNVERVPADPESLALAVQQGRELGAPPAPGGALRSADDPPRLRTPRADGASGGGGAPSANTLRLGPILPNPTRDGCEITFALDREARVTLEIFDVGGRLVRVVATDRMAAGEHVVRWDARDMSGSVARAGLYFARLRAGDRTLTARFIVTP
jgi:hypothetical protein